MMLDYLLKLSFSKPLMITNENNHLGLFTVPDGLLDGLLRP
jgi:hypothetical protein